MLRAIRNIFILLFIGIIGSGVPIYAGNINFAALLPAMVSQDNLIMVSTEKNMISKNHTQISYSFSTDLSIDYDRVLLNEEEPFTVELISGNTSQNLSIGDLVLEDNYKGIEIYGGTSSPIIFDFNQERLNLPDGTYKVRIQPNAENAKLDIDQAEFDIEFQSEGVYVPALSANGSPAAGKTVLTLYFPDNEMNFLIPITRFVSYTTSPLTVTLRNLEKGPHRDLGLPTMSPIPLGGKAGKVSSSAYINLPADLQGYDQGSTKATLALHSLLNSLTSVQGISSVQLQFNGKTLEEAFHGIATDQPFYKSEETMIYTGYLSDTKRFLLSPVPAPMFGSQYTSNIKAIFDLMKYQEKPEIYNFKRHPLVPSDVDLLEYDLRDGVLTLTLNEAFLRAYEDKDHRHQMMVDGILFTFQSVKGVEAVKINVQIDSSGRKEVMPYDFTPPTYINPEN